MKKVRLDVHILEKNLSESRSQVQRLIMAGQVRVDGQVVLKPSAQISPEAEISIDAGQKYVSRGGEKLEGALSHFDMLDLHGKVCADVGASTGGFSDCLLQHGAERIYAIDVGHHILHWKIRSDARVIVMESTNARFIESLAEQIDLVTIDVSFISLEVILPVVKNWLKEESGAVIALIKPQFEAGKQEAARGKGVIRDQNIHRRVITNVLHFAQKEGYHVRGVTTSALLGPKGNVEFLTLLTLPGNTLHDIDAMVNNLLEIDAIDEIDR